MSEKRMAGEEIKKNPEASEAINRSEKNKSYRESLLKDESARDARIARSTAAEGYDMSGLDQDNVSQALQGKEWGEKDQARYDKLMGLGGDEEKKEEQLIPEKEPTYSTQPVPTLSQPIEEKPDVVFGGPSGPGSPQSVYQDNDVNSSVTGDNNVVNFKQDNRVNQQQGALAATNLMDNYVLNLRKSKATV
jgi:hypothetical protein